MSNVGVVALTPENKLIIAKQLRGGPERIMYETPGGACEENGDPADGARRELLEETGYSSQAELEPLGIICRDAYCTNDTYYYLLKGCVRTNKQDLDENEYVDVELLDFDSIMEYITTGRVSDSTAFLLAKDKIINRS